jgi:anti-sigma factor RsiW
MPALNEREREELVAYLDGELDGKRAREVEARISLDPAVRAEAEALRQAWDLLEYLPRAEPSTGFTHRTLERLAVTRRATVAAPRRPSWLRGLAWAAAILLAAGLGYVVVSRLGPSGVQSQEGADVEEQMAQHLHVIQNQHLYELVDDLEILQALDDPNLFGDDPGS